MKPWEKPKGERKREANPPASSSSSSVIPKKKNRIATSSTVETSSTSTSKTESSTISSSSSSKDLVGNLISITDLLDILKNFDDSSSSSGGTQSATAASGRINIIQIENCILDAIKTRMVKDDKIDFTLYEILLAATKSYSSHFRTPSILETLLNVIRTANTDNKFKPSDSVFNTSSYNGAVCAINLLLIAYAEIEVWPLPFVEIWFEDAVNCRNWVDKPLCEGFIENLMVSFGTKASPTQLLGVEPPTTGGAGAAASSSFATSKKEADSEELANLIKKYAAGSKTVKPRFIDMETEVETLIVNIGRDLIQKKAPEIPKNLLRALSASCGLTGVRTLAVTKLEHWIHNPKCGRQAQVLLLSLCVNANCNSTRDAEVVVAISKLRIKSKAMSQFYVTAVREMVKDDDNNMRNVLSQVVYNELSLARNPNNLPLLGSIIPASPQAFTFLADIVMDLLQRKEDFLSAIRLIIREIVRASRFDCDLFKFIDGLLQTREIIWREPEIRDRAFKSVTELIVVSMFLSLSPMVKEASSLSSVRSDDKDLGVLTNFHNTISKIQEEGIRWLYLIAPKVFLPTKRDFGPAINKILLRDPLSDIQTRDGWPPENEKTLFGKLFVHAPLAENSLVWILFQSIPKDPSQTYLSLNEILDLAEHVVLRAAGHNSLQPLVKLEIIELLFRLTQYKHPENIILPAGYEPPKLAVSKSYWRVWVLLCVIASFNPSTLGKVSWDSYPTLKALMEMCMTNHFSFPTPSSSATVESVQSNEQQIAALEKEQILEFEVHLAAASSKQTITEKTSLLLSQVMRLDPLGVCRAPPQNVLTHLQSLNEKLRLGHYLCRSRSPDFLVDLLQRNSQPMPWLSELISEGSFEMLPIQCLCEFLLGQSHLLKKSLALETQRLESSNADKSSAKKVPTKLTETTREDVKGMQLVHFLKDVLHGHNQDSVRELLEYILERLSNSKTSSRVQALQALQLLFSSPPSKSSSSTSTTTTSSEENWLIDGVPNLRLFPEMQEMITKHLRKAIQFESEPQWVGRYIEFLSSWGFIHADSEIDSIALDVAQVVVERNCIVSLLLQQSPSPAPTSGSDHHQKAYDYLFDIFLSFMKKVRGPHKESYKWCDGQDQILLKWESERLEAEVNILIIHAIVILLSSYSSYLSSRSGEQKSAKDGGSGFKIDMRYKELLEIWFPRRAENSPKGFLLNTSEEAVLYPDWIKLRMIRSDNSRLLSAALSDITVDQLLLFVQSFGIPIKSMTALLLSVDKAIEQDAGKTTAAIGDAQYMNTLVKMQWERGATGGEKFSKLLESLVMEVSEIEDTRKDKADRVEIRPKITRSKSAGIGAKSGIPLSKPYLRFQKQLKPTPGVTLGATGEKWPNQQRAETLSIRELSNQLMSASSTSTGMTGIFSTSTAAAPLSTNSIGHTVDTILKIEPETIQNAQDIQFPLLFGRNVSARGLPCRSLLLTSLIHESSWTTIEKCIQKFLAKFDSAYDPSAILDLIATTITNPKLWQGCDKYIPKHHRSQSVVLMKLSREQLLVMAEYIMEEISGEDVQVVLVVPATGDEQGKNSNNAKFSISHLLSFDENTSAGSGIGKSASAAQTSGVGGGKPSSGSSTTTAGKHSIQDRVKLWVHCCTSNSVGVDENINILVSSKSPHTGLTTFLSQVYLEFPEVVANFGGTGLDPPPSSTSAEQQQQQQQTSVLDNITHALIYAISNVQPSKEYKKMASEVEQCLRKIASAHPTLLLRQLNLMKTLLEGRTHLEYNVFHSQNHQVPFQVFLGLLELVQPHLQAYMPTLELILVLYIKVFTSYGHLKDYSTSIGRFSVFIQKLLRGGNPSGLREVLSVHYEGLRELSKVKYYEEVEQFQLLMNSLVPPSSGSELSVLTSEVNDSNLGLMVNELISRVKTAQKQEELLSILQELETLSARHPSVLHHFTDLFFLLLRSENDNCRSQTISLILKHMTSFPEMSHLYLEPILKALHSKDSLTNFNLIKRFQEFIVLSQEHGLELLKELFQLGISSNNTTVLPAIMKTIEFLRLQKSQ